MGIAIKLTNLDFSNNKLGTVTPTSGGEEPRELVTPGEISISSSAEYTFAKQGIWYVSQNKNVDESTAIAYLTFESTRGIVRFDYQISSESFDHGYITTSSGTELLDTSGIDSGYVDVNVENGVNVVVLKYKKDSDVSEEDDVFRVKLAEICGGPTLPSVTSITVSGNSDTSATYETYSYNYYPSDAQHNISWNINSGGSPYYIEPDYYWYPTENTIRIRIPFKDSGSTADFYLYAEDSLTDIMGDMTVTSNREWKPTTLIASDFKADMSLATAASSGSSYRHYLPFAAWYNSNDLHVNRRMGLYIHRDNCPGEYINPNDNYSDSKGHNLQSIIQTKKAFESQYSTMLIPQGCRKITLYHNQPALVVNAYLEQNDGKGNSSTLLTTGDVASGVSKSVNVPSNCRGTCKNLKDASKFLIIVCKNASNSNTDIPSNLRNIVPTGFKLTLEYALTATVDSTLYDSTSKQINVSFNADYTYNKCYMYLTYWQGNVNSQTEFTALIDASDSAISLPNIAIGRYIYSSYMIAASAIMFGNSQQNFTFKKLSSSTGYQIKNTKKSYSITIKGIAITNTEYSSWSAIPNDYKVTF